MNASPTKALDRARTEHPVDRVLGVLLPDANRCNGFRLDQAFVHRSLLPHVIDLRYEWGRNGVVNARRDALSDHAAVILDIENVG